MSRGNPGREPQYRGDQIRDAAHAGDTYGTDETAKARNLGLFFIAVDERHEIDCCPSTHLAQQMIRSQTVPAIRRVRQAM
jgi:hypothetical protein